MQVFITKWPHEFFEFLRYTRISFYPWPQQFFDFNRISTALIALTNHYGNLY